MELDLFIICKILNLFSHQLDGRWAGIIYLGCGIGKLSFWDQIIGNSLINPVEDELRPQDISSCWYSKKTWYSYVVTKAQIPREAASWKCNPKWELEYSLLWWNQSMNLTYLQSFETGALFLSVGYGPISRKIYLSLM